MREAAVFDFVLRLLAIVAVVAVAAAAGKPWLALAVLLMGVGLLALWHGGHRPAVPRIRTAPPHRGRRELRRVLVVANEALEDERVQAQLAYYGRNDRLFVLAPVSVSSTRWWTSDDDGARRRAAARLAAIAEHVRAETRVSEPDALQGIEDALRTFGADEIIVAPRGLDPQLARRARDRFALPVAELPV